MQKINCPACGHGFHAEEVISRQLTRDLEKQFLEKEEILQAEVQLRMKVIETREKELEIKKQRENELFADRIEKEKLRIMDHLRQEHQKDFQLKLFTLENERKEMAERLDHLTRAAVENEQLKRKLDSHRSEVELQMQIKLTEELRKNRDEIRLDEQKRADLKQRELEKQLDDQKKIIETLQRKSIQGSMQLQGEVQAVSYTHLTLPTILLV